MQTAAAAAASLQPLEQLRNDMELALQLAAALEQCISLYLPASTVQMEMQVAAMLANMESVGLGKSQSTCSWPLHARTPARRAKPNAARVSLLHLGVACRFQRRVLVAS